MQHNAICVVMHEENYIRKELEFILLRVNRLLKDGRNTEVKTYVFLLINIFTAAQMFLQSYYKTILKVSNL